MAFWAPFAISAATSVFSSMSKNSAASQQAAQQNAADQRAFANQSAQSAYTSEIEKLQINDYNAQTVTDYATLIGNYNQQIALNRSAATGALASSQWKLNETFAKAAFTRNELGKELMTMMGEQAARGTGRTSSKSADRARMLESLAEFGRSSALLDKTLTSARTQAKTKFGAIAGKQFQADLNAYSKIQIPPRMRTPKTGGGPNLQSPIARSTSSGLGIAQIASAGVSGLAAGGEAAGWFD
tara:strand:- start:1216 stop:1941 length:726 start_codon:yes stop_codon:yes gene_type:complete